MNSMLVNQTGTVVRPSVFGQNMSMSTAELFESAKRLRPVERLQLIDALMDSLDEPDPAIESAWAAEAQDRLVAYDRGELKAAPIQELFEKLRGL